MVPPKAPPIDFDLIAFFNHPGTPILDQVMEAASNGPLLIALACALGLYILWRSPHKIAGVLVLILSIAATDMTAARVVKPFFERMRPCNLTPPASQTVIACQKGLSFPSNHAANAAAVAVVAGWAAPVLSFWCIAIAVLVGTSRVYLGQHWPTDVLGGWALGSLVAFLIIQIFRLRYSLHRRPTPQGPAR